MFEIIAKRIGISRQPVTYTLAIIPLTTLDLAISFFVDSDAVLATLKPTSVILTTVRPIVNNVRLKSKIYLPSKDTVSFTFVTDISTSVFSTIFPSEVAHAMLLIVLPLSVIFTAVDPLVDTMALHLIIDEVTLKSTAVRPDKSTASMFLTSLVVSFEDGAVGPDFLSETIMLVV